MDSIVIKPYQTNEARVKNRYLLNQLLQNSIGHFDVTPLVAALNNANIPYGIVKNVREALETPEIRHILLRSEERIGIKSYVGNRVKKMIDKMKVNYDFVIAGTDDKDKASETLPMLNKVMAFPTTIFIGKDGKVKKIHTGFSGPGTGIYYEQFKQHFNETINELLAEGTALN